MKGVLSLTRGMALLSQRTTSVWRLTKRSRSRRRGSVWGLSSGTGLSPCPSSRSWARRRTWMWRGRLGSPQWGPDGSPRHCTWPDPSVPSSHPLFHPGLFSTTAGGRRVWGSAPEPHSPVFCSCGTALPRVGALGVSLAPRVSSELTLALPGWTKTCSRQRRPQLRLRPLPGSAPAPSSPSPTTRPSSASSPKRSRRGCR